MHDNTITITEVKNAIEKSATGGIHDFGLKRFRSVHTNLYELYLQALKHKEAIPDFFTADITHLLP